MDDRLAANQDRVRALWGGALAAADADDWSEADRLFNETRQFAKANDMRFMELHHHYVAYLTARGEFERSVPHLRFLRDLYVQLGITDYSFLGLRGVPAFEDYLEIVRYFLTARPENMAHLDLLEALVGKLDPAGEAAVEAALTALGAAKKEDPGGAA